MPLPWEAAVRVPSVPGLRHPVALPLPNSVTILPQVSHSLPFPVSFPVAKFGKEYEAWNLYETVKKY